MSILAWILLGIYTVALFYITVYCLMQFNLLYHYWKGGRKKYAASDDSGTGNAAVQRSRRLAMADLDASTYFYGSDDAPNAADREDTDFPFVTVQLPIYNEKYVVERLIDNIVQFDYPKDRFEIHVLDDSTDETVEIVRRKVEEYRGQGFQIEQITRRQRQGFKAGALRDATPLARGVFIAIFDADFLPRVDFLRRTIPHFRNRRIGVVQTRWEHINEEYSLLTRMQALQLNVHFTVEQGGRMAGNYLLQFNGTAGVWRREAIQDAGGWEADTLTEDLDLSIRAQLRGWKIRYLEEIGSPAELPIEMNSLKSQQFRWMKGGAETARKMLPSIWRADLSLWTKMQATFHLLASTVFLFVFLTGVISVPLLFFMDELISMGFDRDYFAYFLIGLLSIVAVYYVGNVVAPVHRVPLPRAIGRFAVRFPLFLSLSMGMSLHNSGAVLQGYLGRKSAFVRTPKFNIRSMKDKVTGNAYISGQLSWGTIFEGLLALYFLGAVIGGIYLVNTTFIIFHLMLAFGFGAIFYYSVRHLRRR